MIWPGRHQIGMVAAMRLEWVAAFVGIRNGGGHAFAKRVRELVASGPLEHVAEALLAAWEAIGNQVAALSRRLVAVELCGKLGDGQRIRRRSVLASA
jgi:hypothetical protein